VQMPFIDNAHEATAAIRAPWEITPSRLVSWWEMQEFSAYRFYAIGSYLAGLKNDLKHSNYKSIEAGSFGLSGPVGQVLQVIRGECELIGLTISIKCLDQISGKGQEGMAVSEFTDSLRHLGDIILWEMQGRLFMFIPSTRSERYEQEQAFGVTVSDSFRSSAFDIREAGNCFATARYTACVFHLMRVLEIGLVAFAGRFPAVSTKKENWQQIIEQIESEIRALPHAANKPSDWKEKLEQYSQAANTFMFFKDAWRNYTAHVRGKFTEDEADAIYRNVRSFMQQLAKIGVTE